MAEMLAILLLMALAALFWQQRRQAELAWQYLRRYCQHHDLQLLSVARSQRKWNRQPWGLQTHYLFEFSSDGESRYQGCLIMQGLHAVKVDLPPYRMPN